MYEKTINVSFENTEIAIPVGYDESLQLTYGDYRRPVKSPSIHGDMYVDLCNDYSNYDNGSLIFNKDNFAY